MRLFRKKRKYRLYIDYILKKSLLRLLVSIAFVFSLQILANNEAIAFIINDLLMRVECIFIISLFLLFVKFKLYILIGVVII